MWRLCLSCAALASVLVGVLAWLFFVAAKSRRFIAKATVCEGLPYAGTSSFNKDRRQGVTRHIQNVWQTGSTFITCTYELGAKFLDLEENSSGNYKISNRSRSRRGLGVGPTLSRRWISRVN